MLVRYPERRQPFFEIFARLKANLVEHGSFVHPRPKTYNKENRERKEIDVLGYIEATPSSSCRKIEKEIGVPKTDAQRILKEYKYHPYKFNIVQHLHPGDAERRALFCQWYLQQIDANDLFGRLVIWSDECFFSSAGIFNRHNTRNWHSENQHLMFERAQQGRFGVGVSCFILGRHIVYRIFEGGLIAHRYLEILEDVIPELLENIPLAQYNDVYLQQDGAPSHNSRLLRAFLDNNFPQRWIGTNGPVRWPPRSPDLSILDFFLWGYIQNEVYKTRYDGIAELREAIHLAFRNLRMRPMVLFNAIKRITKMCQFCIRENGRQFQHHL